MGKAQSNVRGASHSRKLSPPGLGGGVDLLLHDPVAEPMGYPAEVKMPPFESESDGDWEYDVAISLLSDDEGVGQKLSDRLQRAGWEVFFYPERLRETAGPEGIEKFRTVFRNKSRFSVVLFREGWGETDWTAVEGQAIKERQLEDRWRSFQVVRVGPGEMPDWVPEDHIYVDFDEYGVEGAAAVVDDKLRRGGADASPETATEMAERLQREEERKQLQQQILDSEEGVKLAESALSEMKSLSQLKVEEIANSGVDIEVVASNRHGLLWGVNLPSTGTTFGWSRQYSNSLEHASLLVRELDGPAHFGHWGGRESQEINTERFDPALDTGGNVVWKGEREPGRVLSSDDLVERYLSRLLSRHFGDDDSTGESWPTLRF